MSAAEDTRAMSEIWVALEAEERQAVIRLAERIRKGQFAYGVLNLRADKRDWVAEQQAERDDLEIYHVYAELQQDLKAAGK